MSGYSPLSVAETCSCGATFRGVSSSHLSFDQERLVKAAKAWREGHQHAFPPVAPAPVYPHYYPEPPQWWQNPVTCTFTTSVDTADAETPRGPDPRSER